jgi:hypothetical protein
MLTITHKNARGVLRRAGDLVRTLSDEGAGAAER